MQYPMDERDGDRPFAHRRCHPLDITASHVTNGKHPGKARFQKIRSPRKRPARGCQISLREIRTGLDKIFSVERDTAVEPASSRKRARHEKNMSYVASLDSSTLVAPAHMLEMLSAF